MSNRYNIEFIREKSIILLISKGMEKKDAEIFVDSMLQADMCGVSTHGIRMLPSYISKIDNGEFFFGEIEIVKQFSAFSVIDARNTIGAVSAKKATDIAVEKAKTEGIHTVFSKNSNTFGPGFYYVEKIANEGMVGFACCNSPAAMPLFNGLEAMLGTNPLAFACPTKSHGHIVMDMATSVVAKSKFGMAKSKGEMLQPGWALDKEGNPTVDPDEAIQGFVLPMAGFKGYGIAMIIDILSGFLSGASYLNKVGKFYSHDRTCMDVGHMIVAINPKMLYDGDFLADADIYVERLRESKSIGGKEIIVPGDARKKRRAVSSEQGIELTEDVLKKLQNLFKEQLPKGQA